MMITSSLIHAERKKTSVFDGMRANTNRYSFEGGAVCYDLVNLNDYITEM